ncbi:MAG TPA: single-stranded-DNA-specific exonuclease RecJ [Ruminiclostridium sp.]|nr:single-stranded-DNA-specific exonuclease RecJ [Ruminiclostridium sp.]
MKNYYLGNVRRWVIAETPVKDDLFSGEGKDVPEILKKLLSQRNIKNVGEAEAFLNPSLESMVDPFVLEGMESAAQRIIQAVQSKEKILVYGDYDVDGVSATAMLVHFLKSFGTEAEYYIPDRIEEGYGISDLAVEYIGSRDYNLLITVDCGITARSQIEAIQKLCAENGRLMDIIVTDHHQCNPELMPEALAVLNPHIPGSKYPFKNLCGAGLALKLIHAVGIRLNCSDEYKNYLDLAALATIADVVELTGENRIIAKFGIEKITKNPSLGIKALLKASEIQRNQVDSFRISFGLAPRINAAGRMGCANCAVNLFTTEDEAEAGRIAMELNQSNSKRQEVQEEIFNDAVQIIEEDTRYKQEKVMIVYGGGWHHGVIGIVASKLVDRYHKPAFVISSDGGKAVGSGRSIAGFNLFHAMESQSDILMKYGGHEQAGGLTILTENLEVFRERINVYAESHISDEMLVPTVSSQLEAAEGDICLDTVKIIQRLEPFGEGNEVPLFCYRGAVLQSKKVIGNGKHLKLTFGIGSRKADGVYFGKGYLDPGLFIGDEVDIIFTQEINLWQNTEYLQLRICDMHLRDSALNRNRFIARAARQVECLDCDQNWLYNGIIDKIISSDDIVVNRDVLGIIYKYIVHMEPKSFSFTDLFVHARILENKTQRNINCFKLFVALIVFDELKLIDLNLESDGKYSITLPGNVKKVNLDDSEILDWVHQAAQGFI